ncbi:MAG: hypothetical protein EXR77_14190 [Myxococcales bacterium]|nr:hypothetical protein [Myxococcales bacterium]
MNFAGVQVVSAFPAHVDVQVGSALALIDELNDLDLVVALAFSEKKNQVFVGCMDNLVRQDDGGQVIEHTKCIVDDDCTATSAAAQFAAGAVDARP